MALDTSDYFPGCRNLYFAIARFIPEPFAWGCDVSARSGDHDGDRTHYETQGEITQMRRASKVKTPKDALQQNHFANLNWQNSFGKNITKYLEP